MGRPVPRRSREDQWAFLASIRKIARLQAEQIVGDAEQRGRVLGVRLPLQEDGETEPWTAPPSRRREAPIVGELPATLELVLSNQIYIPKQGLNPGLRNRLLRLAAFQNPEFYKAQLCRRSADWAPRFHVPGGDPLKKIARRDYTSRIVERSQSLEGSALRCFRA